MPATHILPAVSWHFQPQFHPLFSAPHLVASRYQLQRNPETPPILRLASFNLPAHHAFRRRFPPRKGTRVDHVPGGGDLVDRGLGGEGGGGAGQGKGQGGGGLHGCWSLGVTFELMGESNVREKRDQMRGENTFRVVIQSVHRSWTRFRFGSFQRPTSRLKVSIDSSDIASE